MKAATAVLSATVLEARLPNQLYLVLVRFYLQHVQYKTLDYPLWSGNYVRWLLSKLVSVYRVQV